MKLSKKNFILLCLITLFAFLFRVYRFAEPNHYYFDEVYHAVTAKAYADNNPAPYDPFSPPPKQGTAYDWLHPPLAKLIQAGSIKIFGDNSVGWRTPSVVFGTAIIPATFLLGYLIFGVEVGLFAALVISMENLNLVMSRITMNDVFITFFTIVAFAIGYLYSKKKTLQLLILTSVLLGLAVASKWTGLYAIFSVFIFILLKDLKDRKIYFKNVLLILIPIGIYLLSYGQFWLQGHTIGQFVDLHKQIWWYQNRHDLEHPYGTTPLWCVPKGLNGPKTWCPWVLDVRPVYFSYEQYGDKQSSQGSNSEKSADLKSGYIYALGNPLIFWGGVIAVSYLIADFIEDRKRGKVLILLGYFIFWLPWIFSPRILFMYHYLPSTPFLAVALGFSLFKIRRTRSKYLPYLILAIFLGVFLYFYPITSGLPIPTADIDKYMWLKTWR